MTYIELINAVLRRLRESEVTTPSQTKYSALVGDLINEAKREVEDAWNWNTTMTTIQVETEAGLPRYELTGSGDRYVVIDVYDEDNKHFLTRQIHKRMTQLLLENPQSSYPMYYDFNDKTVDGDTYVDIYPIPDSAYLINFNLYRSQPDFSTGNETLEVPHWPVILGAYSKAIAERGEDQGNTGGEAQRAYMSALSDAIALDNANTLGEDTWYV